MVGLAALTVVLVYLAASLVVATHAVLQRWLLWAARRSRAGGTPRAPVGPGPLPRITVQLPVFNERFVVERLLDHVAGLRYPRRLLEVQVLDDSTDDTSELVAGWIRRRGQRLDVSHLRRRRRTGFKAGALAEGLHRARGELIAIFDADFLPPPDFLERVLPWFSDPRVAVVQGRWGHANRDESALTRVTALMLDVHFQVEQVGRAALGGFVNFNGAGGVWRAEAIRAAGGWSAETLTEDLDLSYRTQLLGWRAVYDPTLVVPAELPASLRALRGQQYRWMKGVAENARRLLPRVARSRLPWQVRLHACAHLAESSVFLALAALVVTAAPMGVLVAGDAVPAWLAVQPVFLGAFLLLMPVYRYPYAREVSSSAGRFLATYLGFLLLSTGLTAQNALAVLAGVTGRWSPFERTPKRGACLDQARWRASGYLPRRLGPVARAEAGIWVASVMVLAVAAGAGVAHLMWPLALSALGQAALFVAAWRESRSTISSQPRYVP